MKLNNKIAVLSALIVMLNNAQGFAAGYQTGIYGTSGLGNAYAGGATGIHDASDMFFNPAITANLEKSQLIASVSYLNLKIDPDNAKGNIFGNNIQGNEVKDAGVNVFVPALYFSRPISPDVAFGLAINSPFGLATKYNSNWAGKYKGIESSIATFNFNPSLSYKINSQLSIGAGVSAQYYKAKLTKSVYNPYSGSSALGISEGNDWGYGYNLGAAYQINDQLKLGLGYRSKIDYKLSGKTAVKDWALNSKFNASTSTPESLTFGTAWQLNKTVELAYDIAWTRWSRLKNLTIDNYQNQNLNSEKTTNFNWHDSFLHSVGANFRLTDKWLLRTGAAFEKDATSDCCREVRIPTGDRFWSTVGFNYKINDRFSVDGAYVRQFYQAAKVNLNAPLSGSFQGKYKTSVDVFSFAVKTEF